MTVVHWLCSEQCNWRGLGGASCNKNGVPGVMHVDHVAGVTETTISQRGMFNNTCLLASLDVRGSCELLPVLLRWNLTAHCHQQSTPDQACHETEHAAYMHTLVCFCPSLLSSSAACQFSNMFKQLPNPCRTAVQHGITQTSYPSPKKRCSTQALACSRRQVFYLVQPAGQLAQSLSSFCSSPLGY